MICEALVPEGRNPVMNAAPQGSSKVSAAHLRRGAYLYVRQSTIKQVLNNTESTLRQYDLRGRAIRSTSPDIAGGGPGFG